MVFAHRVGFIDVEHESKVEVEAVAGQGKVPQGYGKGGGGGGGVGESGSAGGGRRVDVAFGEFDDLCSGMPFVTTRRRGTLHALT